MPSSTRSRPSRRLPRSGREPNPDDHRTKKKGQFFHACHYPMASDLTRYEWMFRQQHHGAKLAFIGGVIRPHQVEKFMRLGCDLEWLVTGHDRQLGTERSVVETVRRGHHDFVFLWTGHINHALFGRVRVAIRQAAVARRERGQPPLRYVNATSLNTEEMARLFLVGDPALPTLEKAWQDQTVRIAS